MSELITTFADFHFLRPWWLLTLVLIPLLYRYSRNYRQLNTSWAQAIDQHLLRHLLQTSVIKNSSASLYLLIFGVLLTSIAMAGPAWKKIPQPVHKMEDGLVILLDLSLSMQATDIQPSRLIKARHKLIDMLDLRQQGQTALVVYAGDAHIVSPLTDDTDTIKAMVPALSPLIMPAFGSRPDLAMELALQLLKGGAINEGRILLITDGITIDDAEQLADLLEPGRHQLALMSVGTEAGSPIPIPKQGFLKQDGEIVIAKYDSKPLRQLAHETGARLINLRIDDRDIHYLLENNPLTLTALQQKSREVEREFDQWHEEGPWLLLLLTPLAALAFRRGWLLSVLLLLLVLPTPSYALQWRDLWQTRDQQAAEAYAKGDHQRAAELFQSEAWQGSAKYRAGDYAAASESFATEHTADAHYNRANALARAGKLEQALAAYDQALEQSPPHEDARFNRDIVEKLLQQNQQQDQENQQQDQDQNKDQDQDKSQDQNKDQSQEQDQQQKNQNSQGDSKPQDSSQQDSESKNEDNQSPSESEQEQEQEQEKEQKQKQEQQKNQEQGSKDPEQQADQDQQQAKTPQQLEAEATEAEEQQQAREQWLRRIPDDPSGLLQRKFNYQYRQRQLEDQFLPQQEDQAIW